MGWYLAGGVISILDASQQVCRIFPILIKLLHIPGVSGCQPLADETPKQIHSKPFHSL